MDCFIRQQFHGLRYRFLLIVLFFQPFTLVAAEEQAQESPSPWWIWPLILLLVTFLMGIVAVLGGVGGVVLFVPIISGFFPFHLDFVRGTGLLVALSGALAAGPGLLKSNLASLRLAMPVALIASTMAIVVIMLSASKSELPHVEQADSLSTALRITGIYHEPSMNRDIPWKIHRTWPGLISFIIIGFMAGMFGLGAGWANAPVLNLLMGAPLKISVATSKFLLSITDTSAAWIYLNKGAVIPMMVLPSLIGIMLGSFVGVRILKVAKPTFIRWMVIGILFFAGLKAISKGLESYGVTFF